MVTRFFWQPWLRKYIGTSEIQNTEHWISKVVEQSPKGIPEQDRGEKERQKWRGPFVEGLRCSSGGWTCCNKGWAESYYNDWAWTGNKKDWTLPWSSESILKRRTCWLFSSSNTMSFRFETEVKSAVKARKSGKTPGNDFILEEMPKICRPRNIHGCFGGPFQDYMYLGRRWSQEKACCLQICDSFRGIRLLSITSWREKGCYTIDQHICHSWVASNSGTTLYINFMNFKKAFDIAMVAPTGRTYSLVPAKILALIEKFNGNSECNVLHELGN